VPEKLGARLALRLGLADAQPSLSECVTDGESTLGGVVDPALIRSVRVLSCVVWCEVALVGDKVFPDEDGGVIFGAWRALLI
jgi:hypothetical protein